MVMTKVSNPQALPQTTASTEVQISRWSWRTSPGTALSTECSVALAGRRREPQHSERAVRFSHDRGGSCTHHVTAGNRVPPVSRGASQENGSGCCRQPVGASSRSRATRGRQCPSLVRTDSRFCCSSAIRRSPSGYRSGGALSGRRRLRHGRPYLKCCDAYHSFVLAGRVAAAKVGPRAAP